MRLPQDQKAADKAKKLLKSYTRVWKIRIMLITSGRLLCFCTIAVQLYLLAGLLTELVHQNRKILPALIWLFVFGIVRILISFMTDLMAQRLSVLSVETFRAQLIEQLKNNHTYTKTARLTAGLALEMIGEAEAVGPYYSRYIPQVIQCLIIPLLTIAYIATINWIAALMLLITAPAIPIFMIIIGKGTEEKSKEQWQTLSLLSNYFLDRLRGITTLSLFNRLDEELLLVISSSRQYTLRVMSLLKTAFLSSAVLDFFTAVSIAGVAIYTGLNLLGYIHLGPSASFTMNRSFILLLMTPEFFNALKKLGVYYHDRSQATGAVMHLQEYGILEEFHQECMQEIAIVGRKFEESDPSVPPLISVREVSFSYVPNHNILAQVSLMILPHEKVWITGENGAGKTTLLYLLLRWLSPDSGTILLNGQPLQHLPDLELQRSLSWVGQRTTLFKGSIRANILMGNEMSDEDLYQRILPQVSLLDRIKGMPQGLDTPVTEEAKTLSGGERQKIGLARALVKNTMILLLDEPLTYLDQASGTEFLRLLEKTTQDKTVIMTGHGERYAAMNGFREFKL